MSVKDRYGNNIRRETRVKDLRRDSGSQEGLVVGTAGHGTASSAFVQWDNGEEETVRSTDLVSTEKRMGR